MSIRFGPIVFALTLVACSGGAGSPGNSPVTPIGPSGSAGVQQTSVQRSLASQSLFDTQAAAQIAQFGGGGSLGPASALRRTLDSVAGRSF